MRKCIALLLVTCLAVSGLIVHAIMPVSAQAGYKPSVPQISSIKLVDTSYDVPPSSTTTVDQYTGKETTTTTPSYRVNQKSIEITIKNQPFTPYTVPSDLTGRYGPNGQEFNLYYQVEFKGHFGESWQDFGAYAIQSNSGYTVVSSTVIGQGTNQVNVADYEIGSQLDFRVRASIGHKYNALHDSLAAMFYPGPVWSVQFTQFDYEQSDWSKVQTFTIPGSVPTQTTTFTTPPVTSDDNSSPQFPDQTQPFNGMFTNPLFVLVVSILLGGIIVAVVMVTLRRHFKTSTLGGGLYA